MSEETPVSCAKCSAVWQKCGTTNCWSGDPAQAPPRPGNCPTGAYDDVVQHTLAEYRGDSEDAKIAFVAARVEGLCYQPVPGSDAVNARWTRVEDTIAFAKLMGYRKIGMATCIGLLDETERLAKILTAQGFEPLSVCCKAGSIDKLELGLAEADKVRPGTFEPACNPLAQAEICNRMGTDMNIIVGLCVGHDMLFNKHSKAPVTTLIVKDRVTGHNPIAVLYGQNFYYKRLQKQMVVTGDE
ncbi:MAG TPA: DUF1847 domain-containing protein [Dongiaceae bacterium]|nr:DUF1847 domain-containing protein [Dongiaceae bacterium]